jgi:1,2-diacylglycerol 3-beta-galactosyltransferase
MHPLTPYWFRLYLARSRPGQEEGNIPFVQEAGFGTYSSKPAEIAATVSSWLASPDVLQQMKNAALAAARPQATMDIARDILSLLEERLEKEP